MVGYIYLITDKTNGKQYVGQHHYDKEELDPSYHGSGIIIKHIYNKRPLSLKEEYLKTCYSQVELDEWEKYFIFTLNTLTPNGYNLRDGGNGKLFSEETRRKLSDANKGKHLSEETKRKMSKKLKGLLSGEKHPMFGKHHSEETKIKMSESHKNISDETRRKMSESHKGKIPTNKGKSISDETRIKISDATSGEKNPMFGKHHSEEAKKKIGAVHKDKHPSEESRRKMSESHKGEKNSFFGKHHSEETKEKLSKKVLQFSLNGELVREWESIRECTKNGFWQSSVCLCCQGKQKSHKGFIFQYKD